MPSFVLPPPAPRSAPDADMPSPSFAPLATAVTAASTAAVLPIGSPALGATGGGATMPPPRASPSSTSLDSLAAGGAASAPPLRTFPSAAAAARSITPLDRLASVTETFAEPVALGDDDEGGGGGGGARGGGGGGELLKGGGGASRLPSQTGVGALTPVDDLSMSDTASLRDLESVPSLREGGGGAGSRSAVAASAPLVSLSVNMGLGLGWDIDDGGWDLLPLPPAEASAIDGRLAPRGAAGGGAASAPSSLASPPPSREGGERAGHGFA
jgi:hypothetical protein